MPAILLTPLLLLLAFGLAAQKTIQQTFPTHGVDRLHFTTKYANLRLTVWDREEVAVSGTASVNDGRNDDAFRFEATSQDQSLILRTFLANEERLPQHIIIESSGKRHYISSNDPKAEEKFRKEQGLDDESVAFNGVRVEATLEVKVPRRLATELESTYGDLELIRWEGPIRAKTTYGSIIVGFARLPESEVVLKTTYDFIDVTVPATAAADVELESDYGAIFTDLDLAVDTARSRVKGFSDRIIGRVNGGGRTKLKVNTPQGDIYLRRG